MSHQRAQHGFEPVRTSDIAVGGVKTSSSSSFSSSIHSLEATAQPPKDHYHLAYIILFIQGAGTLFPWNVFITAGDYFSSRFCGTTFYDTYNNYFSLSFTLFNVACLVLALAVQHKISVKSRVVVPFGIIFLAFAVITFLVLQVDADPVLLFWITLVDCAICGGATAFLSGGVFGLAGQLPPLYTQAVMGGQGLAGVSVSIASLASIWASPEKTDDDDAYDCRYYSSIDYSALAYFSVADLVVLISIVCYFVLLTLPFVQYYQAKSNPQKPVGSLQGSVSAGELLDNENPYADESVEAPLMAIDPDHQGLLSDTDFGQLTAYPEAGTASPVRKKKKAKSWSYLSGVFKQVSSLAWGVCFVFTVTISLFPSIAARIQPHSGMGRYNI